MRSSVIETKAFTIKKCKKGSLKKHKKTGSLAYLAKGCQI